MDRSDGQIEGLIFASRQVPLRTRFIEGQIFESSKGQPLSSHGAAWSHTHPAPPRLVRGGPRRIPRQRITHERVRGIPLGPGSMVRRMWSASRHGMRRQMCVQRRQAVQPLHERDWCPVSLVIPTRRGAWDGQKHLPNPQHHVLCRPVLSCLIASRMPVHARSEPRLQTSPAAIAMARMPHSTTARPSSPWWPSIA